ncbi:pilus assembly protein CpaE [Loktanella sp. 3ANDIMAR09]|uniref:AAA family ATPase n=1 Tax=Loktanella sp. 3ANDIMAR09 TaxID=1225657 RepID=UPI0006F96B13|nr:AAA family ATPase [Loktanella sp. 3ANDIMAR09]KQI69229.1 pilus assembly protein CpaE [Loktanella sp. 3ANDIMAR09]
MNNAAAAALIDSTELIACTVSRDVQVFDLLIEDMETALGERWGDLRFDEALAFLSQPEAAELQFLAVAMDAEDEDDLDQISEVVRAARDQGIKVILITEDVSPTTLHRLLRDGGDEFVPYPLPENELSQAIDRVLAPPAETPAAPPALVDEPKALKPTGTHEAVLIAVHGMAGGTGATTFGLNLAWELANVNKKGEQPRVCVLDLDLQYGSMSTYLDLPRREAVLELLSATDMMDSTAFMQALVSFDEKLHVLTAPSDMVPLELIDTDDVGRLLEMARTNFDYVIIDMPTAMVEWSQTVLEASHVYFAMLELDMRSAQNTLRLKRTLQSEDLPFDKLRFVMNRAPGFTDLSGKARVKRMADSLGIPIEVMMPDGGRQVAQSCDHGTPLAVAAPKNALRKELAKLAASVHAVNKSEAADAA